MSYNKITLKDQEFVKNDSTWIEVPKNTILFYQGDIYNIQNWNSL
ncbi:hypothetical protein [Sulfurimonas sp.]